MHLPASLAELQWNEVREMNKSDHPREASRGVPREPHGKESLGWIKSTCPILDQMLLVALLSDLSACGASVKVKRFLTGKHSTFQNA